MAQPTNDINPPDITRADDQTGRDLLRMVRLLFGDLARLHGDDKDLELEREDVAYRLLSLFPPIAFRDYEGPGRNLVVKTATGKRLTRAEWYRHLRNNYGYNHYLADGMVRATEPAGGVERGLVTSLDRAMSRPC